MRVIFIPRTKFGRWSVGFTVVFILLFAIGNLVVSVRGPRAGQAFLSDPLLSIPMLGSGASAIMAFFLGFVSIIRRKERSVLVFMATVIGFLILFFVSGEVLVPH